MFLLVALVLRILFLALPFSCVLRLDFVEVQVRSKLVGIRSEECFELVTSAQTAREDAQQPHELF